MSRDINPVLERIRNKAPQDFLIGPSQKRIPVFPPSKSSLFDMDQLKGQEASTQNQSYRDLNNPKNYIRQKLLPSLTVDYTLGKRYAFLRDNFDFEVVLVIGAGDKIQYYKDFFPESEVIASDVHGQFGPDVVFDAHDIPFKDQTIDLVIAGQVLEHTIRPWEVANEIERVLKIDGMSQIDVPMGFNWHSMPYDFFRFTFTGLRSMFPLSKLVRHEVSEGNGSLVAVTLHAWTVNWFSNKYARRLAFAINRFLFWVFKYTDGFYPKNSIREWTNPKGICMTFQKDGRQRADHELLAEYYDLKS